MRGLALALVLGAGAVQAQEPRALGHGRRLEWTIGRDRREALVYAPPAASRVETPVVFVWHGRGGGMHSAARTYRIHQLWPEVMAVYPEGLPTPGRLTDRAGRRPGWQFSPGDQGDRDLKFFDALLATLKEGYRIDGKRVYATGHSNGGRFTQLLWAARADILAAVAPSATRGDGLFEKLKPKPCLHIAGEQDRRVTFAAQRATMAAIRKVNGSTGEGQRWGESKLGSVILYPSPKGALFVAAIHPGGHEFPEGAPELIVRFFKHCAGL